MKYEIISEVGRELRKAEKGSSKPYYFPCAGRPDSPAAKLVSPSVPSQPSWLFHYISLDATAHDRKLIV